MSALTKEQSLDALVQNYGVDFPEDVTKIGEYYGNIGPELYDEYMQYINFNAEPYNIAPAVEEILKLPKDAKILDVGCGTGLIGKLISKMGYKNITGVDATQKFIDAAKQT
jgi:2-polyprenyl-3-methyl-5-hydroxy-6-metoxy-1,4-benzoquinol methylase